MNIHLVTRYQAMDWDGDGIVGSYDGDGLWSENNMDGQNECNKKQKPMRRKNRMK